MLFPSPAVIELPDNKVFTRQVQVVDTPQGSTGITIAWDIDTDHPHTVSFLSLETMADEVVGVLASGRSERVIIRALDPYDGVDLSAARVPHPVDVLRAHIIQGGGVAAQELSAVVWGDNSVSTLLLDTGIGTYVRYSGEWQLLAPNSVALDDAEIVTVTPEAVSVFDKADAANTTLSIFELPRDIIGETVWPADVGVGTEMPQLDGDQLVAAGNVIPVVASAADIPAALRIAHGQPSVRWYVAKRITALGHADLVPKGW